MVLPSSLSGGDDEPDLHDALLLFGLEPRSVLHRARKDCERFESKYELELLCLENIEIWKCFIHSNSINQKLENAKTQLILSLNSGCRK